MLTYVTRPISDRSAFTGKQVDSQFTVSWSGALDVLEREYRALHGKHLVIEVDVREDQIRNDGMIRADATAAGPAARVVFESKHGPITMATDRFRMVSYRSEGMRASWQHNVYAIALALEALRRVDRYGVSRSGEQYRGYKALPAGIALPSVMTYEQALDVIGRVVNTPARDLLVVSGGDLTGAIRVAKAATHPDRNGGDRAAWDQVEEAVRVIEAGAR